MTLIPTIKLYALFGMSIIETSVYEVKEYAPKVNFIPLWERI